MNVQVVRDSWQQRTSDGVRDSASATVHVDRDRNRGDVPKTPRSVDQQLEETMAADHDPNSDQCGLLGALPRSSEGRSFGDYRIIEEIGRGGMGVVYKVRQVSLDRIVALKTIRAGVLASDGDIARFRLEAQTAGRLGYPNIIQVHQVGEIDGQHVYSMAFIDGIDLSHLIRREQLDPDRIARYLRPSPRRSTTLTNTPSSTGT